MTNAEILVDLKVIIEVLRRHDDTMVGHAVKRLERIYDHIERCLFGKPKPAPESKPIPKKKARKR